MNNRSLSKPEKIAFLTELADLLEKYGVDIAVQETFRGYQNSSTVSISDSYGHDLIVSPVIDHVDAGAEASILECT